VHEKRSVVGIRGKGELFRTYVFLRSKEVLLGVEWTAKKQLPTF
jgi:hypothetical protein